MKQVLLTLFISIPSWLFAQAPTLSFNPSDGAVNVSLGATITISSDQSLRHINNDNITSTTVDALVLLEDGNGPVTIGVTINGGDDQITVTPSALESLTTYTLTIQPVENSSDEATAVQVITFTTGDFTPPVINVASGVDNSGTAFNFLINVDEDATVHYIVDNNTNQPSKTEIDDHENGSGNPADAFGSFSVTGGVNALEVISGLPSFSPTKYYIFYYVEDASPNGNQSGVEARSLPVLNSSSILSVGPFNITLTVNVDEQVQTYYVVTQSATQPSASQIIAGQNSSGGTPDASGNFNVPVADTDENENITGLDDGTLYYIHFVSVDGVGNQTVRGMESATTTDGTPPLVSTRNPVDGAVVDISTSIFTITFDENISIATSGSSAPDNQVRLFRNGVEVEAIDRGDTGVGMNGAITVSGATATIEFVHNLTPNDSYYILIGDDVFKDAAGNEFAGSLAATDWNFTAGGAIVNNAASSICSGSFQSIANIIISETGTGDFNTGASRTLILSLDNTSEFVISNSGVTASGLSADITNISVSVGITSLTVTYSVTGTTVLDNITISGLKVYATGVVTSAAIIRTGGTASQDGNDETGGASPDYATINVGATAPAQPALDGTEDLIHCEGEDLTSKTLTLVDQGASVTYNWYGDNALSDLKVSTTNETVSLVSDLGMTTPAVYGTGTYKFYVVAISACQSAPPVEVVVQVSKNPVADAGTDRTGVTAVCSGTELTLGGNPTLSIPYAPGAHSYSWDYLESTPEPNAEANPVYTVTNASTAASQTYNFEVTITDAYGCSGTDVLTVEVKPTFVPTLTSPSSYSFTPNAPNQTLEALPAGGVFSGVGVVQSGAPSTYQFSPTIAHATDPNTLPKSFDVYYTVTDNGCTIENFVIATFTISNSFFTSLQPEYCSSEYPNPSFDGVDMEVNLNGLNYIRGRELAWNTNSRFAQAPPHDQWTSGTIYFLNALVRYNNELYRCANPGFLGCTGFTPPDGDAQWQQEDILKVKFDGFIGNWYEFYYSGNASGPTIVKKPFSTYTVDGETFNHYTFGTNLNYNGCPDCIYAYPAAYLEFERPEDIILVLPKWDAFRTYYVGALVNYNGSAYKCLMDYSTGQPNLTPSQWQNVTNTNYGNGNYFHEFDADLGVFRSGFMANGQYVYVNRNPTVFFSGLSANQDVCEFDVLDLDNPTSSNGNIYNLTGNFSNQNLLQEFLVRLDGGSTFDYGSGTIENNLINPGLAEFDTKAAFENSTGGAASLKNIEIQYKVNPGTTGSDSEPCYGTSSIVVQVIQNSAFNFAGTVDPEGSVYCYTEGAKNLAAVQGATLINGLAGSPNSVTYSGYGINDLGDSRGRFLPNVAIEQVTPGTTTQQSIPVTAVYRDVNQCLSERVRTFKVNPDIQPAFTFGGRVNYCFEDIANAFSGHTEDFTVGAATITSFGRYNVDYRDPANNLHHLDTISANNTSFSAQTYYNQIQGILTADNFTNDLNQTVNINVIYTETLNSGPGKTCSESYVQPMVINPPAVLDIFGLANNDILCRNDNTNVAQGNLVVFDGSVTGAGVFSLDDDADFSAVNTTLNGTVNTNNGQATINLLNAYNAASAGPDPRQVYLRYQYSAPGCTGPAQVIEGFKISPPPAIAFAGSSPPPGTTFCYDDAVVPLATVQSTNVTLTGFGIMDSGSGDGTGTLNPELAYNTSVSNGGTLNTQQNIVVTARIVDGVGCANVTTVQYQVNPIPAATLNTGSLYYCYEDADRDLQGQQAKSWFTVEYQGVTTPHTETIGSIGSPVPTITWDPAARFDDAVENYGASALTPVNFDVYYSVADNNNCTNTIGPFVISVANQIDVSIAGFAQDTVYCSNANNGVKTLTFNPFPSDPSKRIFKINTQTIPLSSATYDFEPPLSGGHFKLEYVVISGNNCTNTERDTVRVLPSPLAIFNVQPACDSALIDYNADATSNLSSAVYTWTLSDSVRTGQTLQHRFPGVSTYSVQLHVQYPAYNNDPALVCQDSLRLDQIVGPVPNMDFEFFNVCESDQTSFVARPDIPISTVSWDFGDGESTAQGFLASAIPPTSTTSGTYEEPVHKYTGAASYPLTVIGKTAALFGGCADTVSRPVAILKNWAPSPAEPAYNMAALDNGKGFWVKEDVRGNSSWEFNTATKKYIITDELAWVTGASDPYKSEDVSYMNSPCFDLSSFSRPVLSLNHWTDTELSDGAVVQYSVDGGQSWQRLGNVASGLEWYNRLTIQSNPGNQTDLSSGWSLPQQSAWTTGKHTLDVIPGPRTQVRFRIAFSSFINVEDRDGFAFNNVVIEERNRTILVENFTNLDQTANNGNFAGFRATGGVFNTEELVKLQYHHVSARSGSEPDELNKANPIDQNARAAFYGVTNAVRAFIDGGYGQTSSNATFGTGAAPPAPLQTYFSLRSLVTAPVTIDVDFEADPARDPIDTIRTLNVRATIQAMADLGSPGQYNVFIAIAEREVLGQVYVLRKLLPTAAGTPLTSLSSADGPQIIHASYDMRDVTRLPNGDYEPFAVIVFVQHLETKDVLQTAMRQDGTASGEIVTGVEIPAENYIRVYPNPADHLLNIILPGPVRQATPVKLFDSFGKEVFSGVFREGEHMKTVEAKSLSGGLYIIQLHAVGGVIRKKAMVVHE